MKNSPAASSDLAGKTYWNSLWSGRKSSSEVGAGGRLKYIERRFGEFFDESFETLGNTAGKRLIEIGCGDSGWLPYFAKRWRFEIAGLDYSPVGCARAEALLKAAGAEAQIICSDLFEPPPNLIERFDVVVSMGVVEHFDDTSAVLKALRRYLRVGGVVVTIIPNVPGLAGRIQKVLNRPVYDIHVPIDDKALRRAHEEAGFRVLRAEHLVGVNFGVINLNGLPPTKFATRLKSVLLLSLMALSHAVWTTERVFGSFRATRSFSPYVAVLAVRD